MNSIRYFICIYLLIILAGCKEEVVTIDFDISNDECFAPCDVVFSNTSIGEISSYKWEFGDDKSETIQNPTHTYDAVDTYDVTLTAFNKKGKELGKKTKTVTILNEPHLDFTITNNNCSVPCTLIFTNNSTNMSSVASLKWNFGDGSPEVSATPTSGTLDHLYEAPGTMTATLKALSASGKVIATLDKIVTIDTPVFVYARIYSITVNTLTTDTTNNWNETPNLPDLAIEFFSNLDGQYFLSPTLCEDYWNGKITLPITVTGDINGDPYGYFPISSAQNAYIVASLADNDPPAYNPFVNLSFNNPMYLFLKKHAPTFQPINGENLWIYDAPLSGGSGNGSFSGTIRFVYYWQ